MSNDILTFMVTLLGIALCLSLIVILLRGKKIGSGADGPQEIEFRGLRTRTSVVITFLMLSLAPVLLPLWLRHYAPVQQVKPVQQDDPLYETWKVRGRVIGVNEVKKTTTTVYPPPIKLDIDAEGWFQASIPVQRTASGKVSFPNFYLEHPAYDHAEVDLDGFQDGPKYGGRDYKAKYLKDKKWVVLETPIKLQARADVVTPAPQPAPEVTKQ